MVSIQMGVSARRMDLQDSLDGQHIDRILHSNQACPGYAKESGY